MILVRAGGLPLSAWQNIISGPKPEIAPALDLVELESQIQAAFDQVLDALPASTLRTRVYNARKAFFQKKKSYDSLRLLYYWLPLRKNNLFHPP